jgi:proton-translocating NAD(P)+ transhydrogenase subunit alpha
MRVAIPRERRAGERRVAATPESTRRLKELGFDVAIEADAGAAASFGDDDYRAAGAEIIAQPRELWSAGDFILKVQPPAESNEAGVENPLFYESNTRMLFGDARAMVDAVLAELRQLMLQKSA